MRASSPQPARTLPHLAQWALQRYDPPIRLSNLLPRSAGIRKDVLLKRTSGVELEVTTLALRQPVDTVLMWLILRFLRRVNVDKDPMFAGTTLSHGFVEEKYIPQISHGTPSSHLGIVTGLSE